MTSPIMPVYNSADLNKAYPSEVSPRLYGTDAQGALFQYGPNDIISMCASGGSPLNRWLPARAVDTWNQPVAHLSWVAPEGFDGSQTYSEFLADQEDIGECDFGDGTVYQICQYNLTMDRMSFSTRSEPIKQEYIGMKLYERMPVHTIRGEFSGMTLNNDRDWSLARLALLFEDHHNWNVMFGDSTAYPNSYDGINAINTLGYVKNKAIGKGSCDFTDPIVVNGASLTTVEAIYRKICAVVRKLRKRASDRNYIISGDDMAILINPTMLGYLWFHIASGGFANLYKITNIEVSTTPEVIERQLQRLRGGGIGFGVIPVDGIDVPVIPESRLGRNSTLSGSPAVTGDIHILSKRFRGITILEHQYLDWNRMGASAFPDETGLRAGEFAPEFFQGNMIRVVPQQMENNNTCWYYGADMYGRIVPFMNAMQGRINDVTLVVDLEDENESASFTSVDWYAFNGAQGGGGTSLIAGLT